MTRRRVGSGAWGWFAEADASVLGLFPEEISVNPSGRTIGLGRLQELEPVAERIGCVEPLVAGQGLICLHRDTRG